MVFFFKGGRLDTYAEHKYGVSYFAPQIVEPYRVNFKKKKLGVSLKFVDQKWHVGRHRTIPVENMGFEWFMVMDKNNPSVKTLFGVRGNK